MQIVLLGSVLAKDISGINEEVVSRRMELTAYTQKDSLKILNTNIAVDLYKFLDYVVLRIPISHPDLDSKPVEEMAGFLGPLVSYDQSFIGSVIKYYTLYWIELDMHYDYATKVFLVYINKNLALFK